MGKGPEGQPGVMDGAPAVALQEQVPYLIEHQCLSLKWG